MIFRKLHVGIFFLLLVIFSCKKETMVVLDNDSPYYDEIPTPIIQNYINRMYIDLIGREPLDAEMDADVQLLKDHHLDFETRDSLIRKLQLDSTWVAGDSSYRFAYFHRFYDMSKVRLLEGAAKGEFTLRIGIYKNAALVDSLDGDSLSFALNKAKAEKLQVVLDAEAEYREGIINVDVMYARMCNNAIYDLINMNSFNFINATFDDLFFRFPTQQEYAEAFQIIEYNLSGIIFGLSGQNKGDYMNILVGSREFYEGMVRWAYLTLLAREPSTTETFNLVNTYFVDHDFQKVQRLIMKTDEYAHF